MQTHLAVCTRTGIANTLTSEPLPGGDSSLLFSQHAPEVERLEHEQGRCYNGNVYDQCHCKCTHIDRSVRYCRRLCKRGTECTEGKEDSPDGEQPGADNNDKHVEDRFEHSNASAR